MTLSERDKKVIWHPYTQAACEPDPIPIVSAKGAKLYSEDGRSLIDAISSWWVNLHGHSHPYINQKISEQLNKFEHLIFAGFTHQPAIELAERLIEILPKNQKRVFYSDDGSTAVEVAIKMAIQYHYNNGRSLNRIIALDGAYHGDTFGAMSLSQRAAFNKPFENFLFEVSFVPAPLAGFETLCLEQIKRELLAGGVGAIIVEPLIQGAAGMRMYSPKILSEIVCLAKEHNVLIIFDEVFTGFGRTGKLFAADYIEFTPDIVALSKALTAGYLPLGATTATEEIYSSFLSEERQKMFLHGHSYTANPIACTAALASLDLLLEKSTLDAINRISKSHNDFLFSINNHATALNPRNLGTILAIDIVGQSGYYAAIRQKLVDHFIKRGVLIRPLGNVIYCVPPLCITNEELQSVYNAIESALDLT